jgi:hypothetical protein
MSNTLAPTAAASPKGLFARFLGIITSPKETFQSVVAHPKWFGMLALTTILVIAGTVLPMTTEEGRQAALDQQIDQIEAWTGQPVGDEQYDRMEKGMAWAPYTTSVAILVFAPVMALIVSGILFAVFNAAMGGEASFKQVFSVIVHAGVVSSLSAVFTGPLNYFRGAMGSATNLGVLLPMLDDKSFAGRILSMIDLFIIWWVIALAIGLAVLYRRRTQPIALTLFGVYAAIVLCAAAIMSSFGGGN